jgi:dTDP-4-dehydrorhamnose 3,5-epimerase
MDGVTALSGVVLTPLKLVDGPSGQVLHAIRRDDLQYRGFGEAYFSTVRQGGVKGWKRHRRMTLNICVPLGKIRFIVFDDREDSPSRGLCRSVELGRDVYHRLTVPPGLWMLFIGIAPGDSMLLNVADIPHDPDESEARVPGDNRMPSVEEL